MIELWEFFVYINRAVKKKKKEISNVDWHSEDRRHVNLQASNQMPPSGSWRENENQ